MYDYMYDDRLRMLTCIISQTISLREKERETSRQRNRWRDRQQKVDISLGILYWTILVLYCMK